MYASILRTLLYFVAAAMIAISSAVIYFSSKRMTKREFSAVLKNGKYITAQILVFVFIASGLFGIFNHIYKNKSVYAVVSLNYSEASQGLNSNGTRYNMAEITSDEVIKKAIENGALEKVSVSDIKKCLSVSPSVEGSVDTEANYHISTEYIVTYCASGKTQHLDAENVIKLIMTSYKEYYIGKYTDDYSPDILTEKPDFSRMEYMDTVAYFDKEATSVLNYLYGLADAAPSFVTQNNMTFSSIAGKVYQFKETQIDENLKALILQQSVVRDKDGYIDRLSYQNTNTDFDRRKNAVSFDLCNQAINMYAEEMTRVVLVPTWDERGKYYMGRTKVGIDELSVKATEFSDKLAENEKSIMDNNLIINKMSAAAANSAESASVDPIIESVDKSLTAFSNEAIAAGREYFDNKMNQCIAVSINGTSVFSELKSLLVFVLLSYAAAVFVSVSRVFFKKRKNCGEA